MSAENTNSVPAYVVLQIGTRRIALPREAVAELIASPQLFTFPHTTPLISGVVLRRGTILSVLDLAPGISGAPSPETRFYLVVERKISGAVEKCAIPVQGACELVSATLIAQANRVDCAIGCLDLNGEQIDVLDLEKAIATCGARPDELVPAGEVIS